MQGVSQLEVGPSAPAVFQGVGAQLPKRRAQGIAAVFLFPEKREALIFAGNASNDFAIRPEFVEEDQKENREKGSNSDSLQFAEAQQEEGQSRRQRHPQLAVRNEVEEIFHESGEETQRLRGEVREEPVLEGGGGKPE